MVAKFGGPNRVELLETVQDRDEKLETTVQRSWDSGGGGGTKVEDDVCNI